MDSTACLVGSDAPHIDLSFQLLSIRQCDMEEDNPIARHLKLQMSPVAARFCFFRFCKPRTHARVRHVSLNRNVCAGNWFTARIGQFENNRSRTDPDWFRTDLVLDRNKR
jgi:hypothetical protein